MSDSVRPHRQQPTRLPRPWDSPGKNSGAGCHFLLQGMKVKSESEVTQSCLTLRDPMDCSLPGSSIHGIFQARVLEWGAIAFWPHYCMANRRGKGGSSDKFPLLGLQDHCGRWLQKTIASWQESDDKPRLCWKADTLLCWQRSVLSRLWSSHWSWVVVRVGL